LKFFAPVVLVLFLTLSSVPLASTGATFRVWKAPPFHDPGDPLALSVQSCINGTATLPLVKARVAFLIPTFTLTPYNNYGSSFYQFYGTYEHTAPGVKLATNLQWLSTKVNLKFNPALLNHEATLYDFLVSKEAARCGLVMGKNLWLTNDVLVDNGSLFVKGVRQYDVLIMGHEEYVTRAEYDQLRLFVHSGGRIVEMSGNTFWAQVTYNPRTRMETFVGGHGFEFNGAYAWRSDYEPFDAESGNWFGSTFAAGEGPVSGAVPQDTSKLGHGLKGYTDKGHAFTRYNHPSNEVNYVRNFTNTELVATFYGTHYENGVMKHHPPMFAVHAYVHLYGKGQIVCLCIFGENLIGHDRGAQFFLVYAAISGFDQSAPVHMPPPRHPRG
jgi:hypothetical protein